MISSLLVANRGEIAVRIIRSCKELGIHSVLACSEADRNSLASRIADRTICIGPPNSQQSYLNMHAIISAGLASGCEAIHPGIGFLSENAEFSKLVTQADLLFIGATSDIIAMLGDKIQAKQIAQKNNIPLVPGTNEGLKSVAECVEEAKRIGFPVILKAAAGGGGKGMRIVRNLDALQGAFETAQLEAEKAFNDGRMYMERYLENPRHVEVQLIADEHGNTLHLGERDCTVQENHQKLLEESPAPNVNPAMLERMYTDAIRLFQSIDYVGAGTVEFLVDGDEYFFMEVNARLQVEHPVSELRSGIDLVKMQLLLHTSETMPLKQEDIRLDGYALETRVNARSPGKLDFFHAPGGFGVRVETAMYTGCYVPPFYDALVAKVLCHGRSREEVIDRMLRSLDEMKLEGIQTNKEDQMRIIASSKFRSGVYSTKFIEEFKDSES